jgi:hypothetical protein
MSYPSLGAFSSEADDGLHRENASNEVCMERSPVSGLPSTMTGQACSQPLNVIGRVRLAIAAPHLI